MPPPPTHASVNYLGTRNPAATVEIQRRANQQGVVDLVTKDAGTPGSAATPGTVSKRSGSEFSTPHGKRRKKELGTTNQSTYAITLENRWGEGAFRWVNKGQYTPNPMIPGHTGGPQNGQLCVLKEFKTGSVYESSFFDSDIKTVNKANQIIQRFNQNFTGLAKLNILLNIPQVWQATFPDRLGKHKKYLVEPMIEGEFLKFNSNSGYTNGADLMQALSHFSYHTTNGEHLLCDLQGGHYDDCFILTDPVIMSAGNGKEYGPTDLGKEGIDNFFAHHICNGFCQSSWKRPNQPRASSNIPKMKSTSMSLTIGTKKADDERKQKLQAILAKNKW